MKITFNIRETWKWGIIYILAGVIAVISYQVVGKAVFLIAGAYFVLGYIWWAVRVNGKKIYPKIFDKIDEFCGFRPIEK